MMDMRQMILAELASLGKSQAWLAREIGKDPGTLRRILMEPGRVRLSTMLDIFAALGLEVVLTRNPRGRTKVSVRG